MRILVCSDSHGRTSALLDAVRAQAPDCVIHLGDCWRDAQRLTMAMPQLPLEQVPGNCDWDVHAQGERILTLEGVRILLCHGHQYRVKGSYDGLIARARQVGAAVALCGHTHIPHWERVGALQVLNPGAAADGAFALLTVEQGTAQCRLFRA